MTAAGAIVGALLLIGAMVAPLCAQSYPNKPIRFVVPFPPGSTLDTVGRIMGQKLAERLGQPVVIDNRPGAGGNVGYEFVAKAKMSMIGGEIDLMLIVVPTALPQIQAGKVRALAVLRNERLASLPNVPTIKEAGIDNSEVTTWYGILVPAGTPRDIINRLNAEWIRIAAMPDTLEKMQNAGVETMSGTPEQFAELIKAEIARWAKVIKEANVSIE